ncbi:MAG: hypothetical protein SNF33_08185 [Candidatus Algichlamydia australiensis]|nr:hypothetical protein [Chlamydiales bacterium]
MNLEIIRTGINAAFAGSVLYQSSPERIKQIAKYRFATALLGLGAVLINTTRLGLTPSGTLAEKYTAICNRIFGDNGISLTIQKILPLLIISIATFPLAQMVNTRYLPTQSLPESCRWTVSSYQHLMQHYCLINFIFISLDSLLIHNNSGMTINLLLQILLTLSSFQIRNWKEVTSTIFISHTNTPSKYRIIPKVTGFEFRNEIDAFIKPNGSIFSFNERGEEILISKIANQMERIRNFSEYPKDLSFGFINYTFPSFCLFSLPEQYLPAPLYSGLSAFEVFVKSNRGYTRCLGL